MSHHKYSANGLVLKIEPHGEADAFVYLIVEGLGLVRALAKGLRLAKSKLTMNIVDYSQLNVSLVKGKEIWRLTNALSGNSFYQDLHKEKLREETAAKLAKLVLRLMPENIIHDNILKAVLCLWQTLISISKEKVPNLECLFVLNLLFELGYLGDYEKWQKYMGIYEPTEEILLSLEKEKKDIVETINQSLHATHL